MKKARKQKEQDTGYKNGNIEYMALIQFMGPMKVYGSHESLWVPSKFWVENFLKNKYTVHQP